jgi:hypothetical protein
MYFRNIGCANEILCDTSNAQLADEEIYSARRKVPTILIIKINNLIINILLINKSCFVLLNHVRSPIALQLLSQ